MERIEEEPSSSASEPDESATAELPPQPSLTGLYAALRSPVATAATFFTGTNIVEEEKEEVEEETKEGEPPSATVSPLIKRRRKKKRTFDRRFVPVAWKRIPPRPSTMASIISPYATFLDLSSRSGIALYTHGCSELDTNFDGQAKNLTPFLAEVQLRGDECCWTAILNIEITPAVGGNPAVTASILSEHGKISQTVIDNLHATYEAYVNGTTAVPDGTASTGNAAIVKGIIDRKMLFECICKSLTDKFKKTVAQKLLEHKQDGISLLYMLIKDSHTTTTLATRDYKIDLQKLDFSKFGYNIVKLHGEFDNLLAKIRQSGKDIDDEDQIIYLLQAYKTNDNKKFRQHVDNQESAWSTGTLTSPKTLKTNIEAYVQTMIRNGEWKKTKEVQTTALVVNEEGGKQRQRQRQTGNTPSSEDAITKFKGKHPAWKFSRRGNATELTKNNKEYQWCTGPGHHGIGMWVTHDPTSCTGNTRQPAAHVTEGGGTGTQQSSKKKVKVTKKQFKALLSEQLQQQNAFGDDLTELVNQITSRTFE